MNINALTFDKQRQNKMITVTTAVESSSFVPIAQSIRFPQTLVSERSGRGEDTPPVGQKTVLLKATGDRRREISSGAHQERWTVTHGLPFVKEAH